MNKDQQKFLISSINKARLQFLADRHKISPLQQYLNICRNLAMMKPILALLSIIITSCSAKQEGRNLVSINTNIPGYSFFVKGKTGGYWCQADVHDHKNNALIKIYDGVTGKLLYSKRFSVICMLQGNPVGISDLKNQIDYFDGEKFHFKRLAGQDSCWLQ